MSNSENGKAICFYGWLAGAKALLVLIGATLGLAAALYLTVRPRPCTQVEVCDAIVKEVPHNFNAYAMCGLVTILCHELLALVINYRSAAPLMELLPGIRSVFLPAVILCTMFAVLVVENVVFYTSWGSKWFFHASIVPARDSFVPTVIYAEWLINVPLLLILAGKCALGRTLQQIVGSLIKTNVYILLAWSAHFVKDEAFRWGVILASFALYGWVSYEMAQWAIQFRRSAPKGAPTRTLRPCLTIGLIIVFGIYGLVYLASFLSWVTSAQERTFYMVMNIFVKMAMSLAFAGIKTGAYHDMLVGMLVNANLPFQRQVAESYTSGNRMDNLDELSETLLRKSDQIEV